MIATGNSYELVEPFLQRAVREQLPAWQELWDECYERANLRGMAVLVALADPGVPQHLITRALENVTALADAIATQCLRNQLPEDRLPQLLEHPDHVLAERIAWALWHRDPQGELPENLREVWRRVVVEQMEDEHTLEAIFAKDAAIAFDWLSLRIGKANNLHSPWREDEPFKSAIGLMRREQRESLLALLTDDTWPREIVSHLIGGQPELYQLLLERSDLSCLHLEPLRGEPNEDWIPLTRVAMSAGFSPGEVASAARGAMWSWEGSESEMWRRWADAFRLLVTNPDPQIQQIAQAGLDEAEEQVRRAQRAERAEAVHGRR